MISNALFFKTQVTSVLCNSIQARKHKPNTTRFTRIKHLYSYLSNGYKDIELLYTPRYLF
jgi:hypothetical protein